MLFRGSAPALVTPFRHGDVDWDSFKKMLDFQLDSGSDALVICGTTGEPSTLSWDEQQHLVEVSVEHVDGELPIIVGCGGSDTATVAHRASILEQIGANGLLSVTPYYNKTTQRGLIAHYTEVASATSLPIIVYNVPARTGLNIQPDTLVELAKNPQFWAVKEASGDLNQMMEYFRLVGDKLTILSGNDNQVYPMLAMGGGGVISVAANVVPSLMHEMTSTFFDGNTERSLDIQLCLLPLIKQLFSEVNPIPVKAAMSMMGLARNELRLPLVPLSQKNRNMLQQEMENLELM